MGFFDNVQADKRYIKREELRRSLKSVVNDETKNLVSEIYRFIDYAMNNIDVEQFETPHSIAEVEEIAAKWLDSEILSPLTGLKNEFSTANIKYYGKREEINNR